MGQLREIESEIIDLGYQIVAVSPDRPEKAAEAASKNPMKTVMLSDSSMAGARAFGISFQTPEDLVKTYKERFKIDIEADSGETHHQLPVPSIFVLGTDGRIQFTYVNPDYRVRLEPEVLLAVARAGVKEK